MPDHEVAYLEERNRLSGGGVVAVIMLSVGCLAMLLSLGDNSAIRIASYGAIWTGWNVLWGAALIKGSVRRYVVYRKEAD